MISPASVAAHAGNDVERVARLRLAVFALALAMALLVLLVWRRQSAVMQSGDAYKFAELGRNIAEGKGFCFTDGPPTIRRAPLYPGLIALLYLAFGARLLVIQLFQCALVAGTCVLVFEIARHVFSVRTAIVASGIAMVHPMVTRYVPDIQVETLLTFLYTLTLYRTVRLCEEGTVLNGLWVGVFAAGAAMVKGVALPYAALFPIAYLVWRWRSREGRPAHEWILSGWMPVVAMLVAMGFVILPWTFRNYEVTRRFVLISGNASGEFLRGYVFAQPRYYLLRDRAYAVGEEEANAMQEDLYRREGVATGRDPTGLVWVGDEADAERVQNTAAKAKLRADPAGFLKKFVIGLATFWYVMTNRTNSIVVGSLALGAWVLGLVGVARGRAYRHALFWLLPLPIVSLNVIYAVVLSLGRYSAPCIPSLLVLAAFGIESLFGAPTVAAAPPQH